jgi:hypothetical protein
MIRNTETSPNRTIFNRKRQYVAYADEVFMLGRSVRTTEEEVTKIKEAAVSTGLTIDESKTKYMKISKNITHLEQDLIMDLQVYEGVQICRYLGAVINLKRII